MVQVGLMIEGQEDLTWQRWHRMADLAESLGYESLWRSDHLFSLEGDVKRETLEAWISFVTVAERTKRIRFGPLVTPVTYRSPSIVAKMAASIDQLSNGRFELGLGAGWHDREHAAFGICYPDRRTRFEMLEEYLQVVDEMWKKNALTFNGKHYQLDRATAYPRPVQKPRIPIIIGGNGEKKTIPLAARYADEWNGTSLTPSSYKVKRKLLAEQCQKASRSTEKVGCSWMGTLLIGKNDADLKERLGRILRIAKARPEIVERKFEPATLSELGWLAGTPPQVVEQIQALEEVGAQRFMLQLYDYDDVEAIELVAEKVLPKVR